MTAIISSAPAQYTQLELLGKDDKVMLCVIWHAQKGHDGNSAVNGKLNSAHEAFWGDIIDLNMIDLGDKKVAMIGAEKVSDSGMRDSGGLLGSDDIVVHD